MNNLQFITKKKKFAIEFEYFILKYQGGFPTMAFGEKISAGSHWAIVTLGGAVLGLMPSCCKT